jgi:NAD(P)-dependent dehydrogenase (short-subunit alcohol dehydrogenase family)
MPDAEAVGRPSVVVTGGSSGIGEEFCRAAARHGWHVWIGYATGHDRAERLAAEIHGSGGSASTVALPLDDAERLGAGVAIIARSLPLAEAVVLSGAPAPDVAPLVKQTAEQFRRQLECAVVGNHALTVELWRRCFRVRGGGHVLAVLSAAQGPPATPHMASYIAAKGGLEALLHAAAAELGRAGLRVSVLKPGYVETPMLRAFEPLLLELARSTRPARRFLSASDVALALLYGLQNPPPPGSVAELDIDAIRIPS